jgi:hypothetical protein
MTRRTAVASVQDDILDENGNAVRSGYGDSVTLVLVSGQYFDYSPSEMRRKYSFGVDKDSNTTRISVGKGYGLAGYFCDGQTLGVVATRANDGNLHIQTCTYRRGTTPVTIPTYVFTHSEIGRKISEGTDFRVSYRNGHFTIAFLTDPDMEDLGQIRNFIGKNSGDSLAEGKTGFYESSEDAEDAKTSIDYLQKHITVIQFDVLGYDIVRRTVDIRHHNLNGDMSFIPLYFGEDGRVKTHLVNEYREQDFMSFELLGYDNKDLKELFSEKQKNLRDYIQGEMEYLTDIATEELIQQGSFRVYEDYTENGTKAAKIVSSPSFGISKKQGGAKPYYEWKIGISELK